PGVNRWRLNGSASGCGSSFAIVCAYTQPAPGVALKPPVPQPQLRYSPSTGERPTIGDASGLTSTMPAQVRTTCTRLKMGNSSSAAAISRSMTCSPPRCPYELYASMPAPITSSPLCAWLTYTCTVLDLTTQARPGSCRSET